MGSDRHEWKHEIHFSDLPAIRRRLQAVADVDGNAVDGKYLVHSLYFDDPWDRALWEKRDGVDHREKFRMRYYNADVSLIRLEKKSKRSGLCQKQSVPLTLSQARALVEGEYGWMLRHGNPLVRELYGKLFGQLLRPKTVVEYIREPFVYAPGNVRVTLDYDLRTSLGTAGFLDPGRVTIPVAGAPAILEVKWDAFLPDIIRDAVQLKGRRTAAFSKYAACRVYG